MKIHFWKMHGAGNDFILVDDRRMEFPVYDRAWMTRMATRGTGVGSEGIILIQESKKADFKMRFFNPDGTEVEMCGNGARCVARLAHDIKAAPARMTIDTIAGILRAEVRADSVKLGMTVPKAWRLKGELKLGMKKLPYSFVNTGVPHAVIPVRNLDTVAVAELGAKIRHHATFAPAGTNANFIRVTGPHSLSIRTYERGVEAETLACGTGIVASALLAARAGKVKPPVRVTARSGDVLTVDFRLTDTGAEDVSLIGGATYVFQGTIEY